MFMWMNHGDNPKFLQIDSTTLTKSSSDHKSLIYYQTQKSNKLIKSKDDYADFEEIYTLFAGLCYTKNQNIKWTANNI